MGHYRKRVMTFVMSEACNMACKYCYSTENMCDNYRTLSLDFAYEALKDHINAGNTAIRFFGVGEATMEPQKMKKIWERAKELIGNKLYTEVQTNGTFSEDVCEMISEIADLVWISCDGTPDIQDQQRIMKNGTKSSAIIERNIRHILNKGKKVGIRATISGINLRRQKEMIDYFISLGVDCAFADLICLPIMKGNGVYQVTGEDYIDEFIKAKKYADSKQFFYSNFYMVNFDEPVSISCRCMIPMPHLMPSGYVSACDMVTDKTDSLLDVMLYGKYDEEKHTIIYDDEKIKKIQSRNIEHLTLCVDCPVRQYCAGGCAGEAINETNDFYGVKEYLCKITKALASEFGVDYGVPFPYLHP